MQQDLPSHGRDDDLEKNNTARVHRAQYVHTNLNVLRTMLRVLLDESTCTHEGGWHPEDKQHEDLLIQEFAGARVSS